MKGQWTCTRVEHKIRCGHKNPNRKQKCAWCGKRRTPRKKPAHMRALDLSYEQYIELNGGEHCGICGRPPWSGRKLDRDHEHKANGFARGLLCWSCNRQLRTWATEEWLLNAAAYLRRAESRREAN